MQLKITLQIFSYLFLTVQLYAQSSELAQKDSIRVGVAGSEPFVFATSANEKGISIEIWEELADLEDWNYTYKTFGNVEDALQTLENGDLDIVVGPISITSARLEKLKFSQPFYISSLAIVSRQDELNLWQKVKPFFSFKLLYAVFVFLFILAIVGTLLWLAERKASPDQFPQKPIDGIGTGMWLAIVTMTTVGYGDRAPITVFGRIIAGSWMVISIIFATSMVAGIASTLTLSSLGNSTVSTIEELKNRKVATISGSPSDVFLQENNAKIVGVDNLDNAFEKLEKKHVDAIVYDRPQLLYFIKKNHSEDLYVAKAEYYKLGYGFAFPLDSKLTYNVNRTLLDLAEHQKTTEIIEDYLDKDE